jgi:hypothetical protein
VDQTGDARFQTNWSHYCAQFSAGVGVGEPGKNWTAPFLDLELLIFFLDDSSQAD